MEESIISSENKNGSITPTKTTSEEIIIAPHYDIEHYKAFMQEFYKNIIILQDLNNQLEQIQHFLIKNKDTDPKLLLQQQQKKQEQKIQIFLNTTLEPFLKKGQTMFGSNLGYIGYNINNLLRIFGDPKLNFDEKRQQISNRLNSLYEKFKSLFRKRLKNTDILKKLLRSSLFTLYSAQDKIKPSILKMLRIRFPAMNFPAMKLNKLQLWKPLRTPQDILRHLLQATVYNTYILQDKKKLPKKWSLYGPSIVKFDGINQINLLTQLLWSSVINMYIMQQRAVAGLNSYFNKPVFYKRLEPEFALTQLAKSSVINLYLLRGIPVYGLNLSFFGRMYDQLNALMQRKAPLEQKYKPKPKRIKFSMPESPEVSVDSLNITNEVDMDIYDDEYKPEKKETLELISRKETIEKDDGKKESIIKYYVIPKGEVLNSATPAAPEVKKDTDKNDAPPPVDVKKEDGLVTEEAKSPPLAKTELILSQQELNSLFASVMNVYQAMIGKNAPAPVPAAEPAVK